MSGEIIIEHPTRGTLRPDSEPGAGEWHWSSSGARSDPAKTWIFRTVDDARKVFAQLPERMRIGANIRRHNPEVWRHDDPYEIVDVVPLPAEAPVPPARCDAACSHPATCQVVFRTARNAPPGNSGESPSYVLSPKYCDGHGKQYAAGAEGHGYEAVQVLPL